MSDASKDTEAPASKPGGQPSEPEAQTSKREADDSNGAPRRRGRSAAAVKSGASAVKSGTNAVRRRVASVIWLIAVVCALFLAIGALLIALDANEKNRIVQFVLDGAARLDGPFSRTNGIFTFAGKNAEVKSALVNWGLAAIVYLVIGQIIDRIIRP